MIKIRLAIILSICSVMLCVGLEGCGSYSDKDDISENQLSESTGTNVTSIPNASQSPTDVVQSEPSNFPSKDGMDTIDYNQYLKKIWVVKDWNGGAYASSSFFISKIADGVIEGKLSTASIAEPDFYLYSFDSATNLGDLSGTVNNGVAKCQFSDKVGNKGNVTLVFKANDEIEATIEYTDLGSASGEYDSGKAIYPMVFLTNEHDDILYEFEAPFQTGTEIIEASIKDINEDGLKDVMIITAFTEDPDIEHIEWIFLQMDDGLFYENNLDEEMNISDENTDID